MCGGKYLSSELFGAAHWTPAIWCRMESRQWRWWYTFIETQTSPELSLRGMLSRFRAVRDDDGTLIE